MAGAIKNKNASKEKRPALSVIENGVRKRPVETSDKAQKKQRISTAPIEGEVERAKSQLKASLLLGSYGTTAIAEDIGRKVVTAGSIQGPSDGAQHLASIWSDIHRVAQKPIFNIAAPMRPSRIALYSAVPVSIRKHFGPTPSFINVRRRPEIRYRSNFIDSIGKQSPNTVIDFLEKNATYEQRIPQRVQAVDHIYLWDKGIYSYRYGAKNDTAPIEGEVERAKSQLKASLQLALDGTAANAEDIGRQMVTAGKRYSPKEIETAIEAVSTKEIQRVAKTELRDKDIAVAATDRVEGQIDYSDHHTFQFWLKKMNDALDLQDKKKYSRKSVEVRSLCSAVIGICEKQKGCCKRCHVKLAHQVGGGGNWKNATADRINSHSKGGKYIASNIQILCVGCNFMKHYHLEKAAAKLTQYVGETASGSRDDNGIFFDNRTPEDVTEPSSNEMEKLIKPWCREKLAKMSISSGRKIKKIVLVDQDYLVELIKARWIGNGEVQDAAGIRAGLKLMDLDRINSALGYIKGNIRILIHGLNSLKRDYATDDRPFEYVQHLRNVWRSIEVEPGSWIPWQTRTAKIITGEMSLHGHMYAKPKAT